MIAEIAAPEPAVAARTAPSTSASTRASKSAAAAARTAKSASESWASPSLAGLIFSAEISAGRRGHVGARTAARPRQPEAVRIRPGVLRQALAQASRNKKRFAVVAARRKRWCELRRFTVVKRRLQRSLRGGALRVARSRQLRSGA